MDLWSYIFAYCIINVESTSTTLIEDLASRKQVTTKLARPCARRLLLRGQTIGEQGYCHQDLLRCQQNHTYFILRTRSRLFRSFRSQWNLNDWRVRWKRFFNFFTAFQLLCLWIWLSISWVVIDVKIAHCWQPTSQNILHILLEWVVKHLLI